MLTSGRVEVISTEFAIGWSGHDGVAPSYVVATLRGRVIGVARADLLRDDLLPIAGETADKAAFIIRFNQQIASWEMDDLVVERIQDGERIAKAASLRIDRPDILQVFILGSPRSGTSQLAETIASHLELPWGGEGHGAPAFANAAMALCGDPASSNELLRFIGRQKLSRLAVEAAQNAYCFVHSSASFLDKTPGIEMIASAPFIAQCFPAAHFIYVRRNGISNILSRMQKFGGSFEEHCTDWAVGMETWLEVRGNLKNHLELTQEEMIAEPGLVAHRVAVHLHRPETAAAIEISLRSGSRERTGAGIGRTSLEDTDWTATERVTFEHVCGPMMRSFGYWP